jgi:hypothetical protein
MAMVRWKARGERGEQRPCNVISLLVCFASIVDVGYLAPRSALLFVRLQKLNDARQEER